MGIVKTVILGPALHRATTTRGLPEIAYTIAWNEIVRTNAVTAARTLAGNPDLPVALYDQIGTYPDDSTRLLFAQHHPDQRARYLTTERSPQVIEHFALDAQPDVLNAITGAIAANYQQWAHDDLATIVTKVAEHPDLGAHYPRLDHDTARALLRAMFGPEGHQHDNRPLGTLLDEDLGLTTDRGRPNDLVGRVDKNPVAQLTAISHPSLFITELGGWLEALPLCCEALANYASTPEDVTAVLRALEPVITADDDLDYLLDDLFERLEDGLLEAEDQTHIDELIANSALLSAAFRPYLAVRRDEQLLQDLCTGDGHGVRELQDRIEQLELDDTSIAYLYEAIADNAAMPEELLVHIATGTDKNIGPTTAARAAATMAALHPDDGHWIVVLVHHFVTDGIVPGWAEDQVTARFLDAALGAVQRRTWGTEELDDTRTGAMLGQLIGEYPDRHWAEHGPELTLEQLAGDNDAARILGWQTLAEHLRTDEQQQMLAQLLHQRSRNTIADTITILGV